MYSNHKQVNILTALLVAHGVRHAVVCPGSRNAPIVHNLNECPRITCHPVTDERSAAFCALGMAQALQQPVVVCVTSGSALLNTAPAVAEAFYQHVPVVVVSADRPEQWIDQLDGQTLPQRDALGRFVGKAVALPEVQSDEQHWYCNRLVNEALLACRHPQPSPVHINVPISEPLFDFTTRQLPAERKITLLPAQAPASALAHVERMFTSAERPMLITGQPLNPGLDEAVAMVEHDERYVPDFVLCIGGSIVSKRLKRFLRKAREVWMVNATGEVNDTFMNLTQVIQGDGPAFADRIKALMAQRPHPFVMMWERLLQAVARHAEQYEPPYSQMAAVKRFELLVGDGSQWDVHYANSSAIRLANIYARHRVWCNRGVNGIEGSLSTAAGFSVVTDRRVGCVIGDLSFFYDQNALWNEELRGNLRILLLNNHKGGIFHMLPGLEQSPARDRLVAASHSLSARGICQQCGVNWLRADSPATLHEGLHALTAREASRPIVLEVMTSAADDEQALQQYYQSAAIAR